jgi:hypothetical protein
MRLAAAFGGGLVAWTACVFALGTAQESPRQLPPSTLPLTLVGLMVDSADPSRSECLIRCAYPVPRVRAFGPGQSVCDVAEVNEILQDGVVVKNLLTSRLELLTFREAEPLAAVPPPADAQAPAPARPSLPPPVVRKSSDVVTIEVPEASVQHYLANLPELLSSARATPRYRKTGFGQSSIDGFEIDQIRQSSVVEQMGLKNGDVILELNGQPLDSLASAIRLFGQAQGMAQSRMTVLRNGQRITFVLNRKGGAR